MSDDYKNVNIKVCPPKICTQWDDSFWLANKIWFKSVTLKAWCIFNRIFFLHQIAYASSGYHHWNCEFVSRSGEVCSMQHYVIKFISDLRMSVTFFGYSGFIHQLSSPLRYNDMTEILLTVAFKHTPFFSSNCFCNMSKAPFSWQNLHMCKLFCIYVNLHTGANSSMWTHLLTCVNLHHM
jgi:hypothetical protein